MNVVEFEPLVRGHGGHQPREMSADVDIAAGRNSEIGGDIHGAQQFDATGKRRYFYPRIT